MGESKYQNAYGKPSVIESSNISTLFTQLSVELDDTSLPKFFRKRSSDLLSFRSLEEGQNLVLFTPAVRNPQGVDMDPFEPLGRTLSDYHPCVKHIPYTKVGFTSLHREFLSHAGGVVLVLAEPSSERGHPSASDTGPSASIRSQFKFGNTLLKVLRESAISVPLVMVVCADLCDMKESNPSAKTEPHAFGTVLHAGDYDERTLKDVARAIFLQG